MGLRRGLDGRSLRVAGLVGVGHAVMVLWIRSAISVIATPVFDLYVVWAVIGLTLVGAFVTYVFLVGRYITPALGVAVFLGWLIVRQWQYVASLNGLAFSTVPQPLFYYTTFWPLPLLIGLGLSVLEWGGRKLLTTPPPTAE